MNASDWENEYTELHIQPDKESGCTFIIAINTWYSNIGNGGTRMYNYPCVEDGIFDAKRLASVMTKKCIVIGEKYNGGYSGAKGVIIGNPATQKTPDMLRQYGKFVQSLNGRFQTGTDMNINQNDIEYMAEESEFIDGLASGLGDTAIPTAIGVIIAMKTIVKWKYGSENLKGKTIAVQGTGSVGKELIKRLVEEGVNIIVTDTDTGKLTTIKRMYGVQTVTPEDIYAIKCDIFSPNAIGGILTTENISKLNCDVVIGAANNPLSEDLKSVIELKQKGIIYVPDYLINIGGVFLSMCEVQKKRFDFTLEKLKEIIPERIEYIIKESTKNNETLFETAEKIVFNNTWNKHEK